MGLFVARKNLPVIQPAPALRCNDAGRIPKDLMNEWLANETVC